jgi:hypothetical protein
VFGETSCFLKDGYEPCWDDCMLYLMFVCGGGGVAKNKNSQTESGIW